MNINISKDFMIIVGSMIFGLIVLISLVYGSKSRHIEEQRCDSLAKFSHEYHYVFNNEDGGFLSQRQTAELLTSVMRGYAKGMGFSYKDLDKVAFQLEDVSKEENDGLYDMIKDQCHEKYGNWF